MFQSKGNESAEQIEQINLVRGSVYSFLSRAFKTAVDREFLEDIISAGPTVKLLTESQEGADLVEGSQRLGHFIQGVAASSEDRKQDLITELRIEYSSLFMGVGDDAVHLVESAYSNGRSSRYDRPAQDVQVAYESLGFKKDAALGEPEDHVALEFEFMARMCDWVVQALRMRDNGNATAYLSLQKEFLRDHVLSWAPKLCERLKRKARSDFYSSLAYLTKGFVEIDYEVPDHLSAILRTRLTGGALR